MGIVGAILVLLGYLPSNWHQNWLWWVILDCSVNWFGDSLDGILVCITGLIRDAVKLAKQRE